MTSRLHVACGPRFAVHSIATADRVEMFAVESDGRPGADLAGILSTAIGGSTREGPPLVSRVAEGLHTLLRQRAAGGEMPTWLFFAGFVVGPSTVEVCTAGSLRVHLIAGTRLVGSTRDHILRDDEVAANPDLPPDAVRVTPSLATRCLGAGTGAPPENVVWPMPADSARILVCSSEWHNHADWPSYERDVERWRRRSEVPPERAEGMIALLDVP